MNSHFLVCDFDLSRFRRLYRKAVRAALFLLPLLGITHSLEMFEPPLDRPAAVFGCYTIVLALLDSFQGFYISVLYCFLNQEVKFHRTASFIGCLSRRCVEVFQG